MSPTNSRGQILNQILQGYGGTRARLLAKVRLGAFYLAGAVAVLAASHAAAKVLEVVPSPDGAWEATFATVPEAGSDHGLVLNRIGSLTVRIGRRAGAPGSPGSSTKGAVGAPSAPILNGAVLDIRMPLHRHGALVRPKVTAVAADQVRVDGVLLHMAGDWELTLSVLGEGGRTIRFTLPVHVALDLEATLRSLAGTRRPVFDKRARALAHLGRQLFFDPRFSRNGHVACATCHQPERAFTDGLPVGRGLGLTSKNTPTLLNVGSGSWFFADGRTDSLAAQALEPLLGPAEHGLSRWAVVKTLQQFYGPEYKALFGALPPLPEQAGEEPGQPLDVGRPAVPEVVARYAVDTLAMPLKRELLHVAQGAMQPAHRLFLANLVAFPSPPRLAGRPAVDQALANFGRAVAEFERGIVAVDAPFDRFAARVAAGSPAGASVDRALGAGFGKAELAGLRLFAGQGRCILCHSGPNFTDQQFHNVGLPQPAAPFDLGRAAGIVLVRASAFNCLGSLLPRTDRESCRQLPYLDERATEAVGAFKTPTLRNIAQTAPYGHDGRFATLAAVLDHYNQLASEPSLGHREETLQPLHLDPGELANLEVFLRSLTAPIEILAK